MPLNFRNISKLLDFSLSNAVKYVEVGDADEKLSIYFQSPPPMPVNGYYGQVFEDADDVPSSSCFQNEHFRQGGFILPSPIAKSCNRKRYEASLTGLANLNTSHTGNAVALEDILEHSLVSVASERAREIYEELDHINSTLKDLSSIEGSDPHNTGPLTKRYTALLEQLDTTVFSPLKGIFFALIERYDQTVDRNGRKDLEERIGRVGAMIGQYANRDHDEVYLSLNAREARFFEAAKLFSSSYARVYVGPANGRRARLSPSEAEALMRRRWR